MKSITEFMSFQLAKGVTAKAALVAEGKTPEEIQANFGETFKLEGDKLKHFFNSVDVAEKNADSLKRVLVMSLAEGEATPAKAVKVEEFVYLPEMIVKVSSAPKGDSRDAKGGRGGPGRGGKGAGGPKGSPWGLSPEEKAAKNKGGAPKA
jgi:hypothetical protein